MVSRTALTCNHYAAGCTKTEPEILQVKRGQKQRNAPDSARKRRNRVRFGCWRGWQRLGTDKTRCEKPKFEPKRTPFPCTTCKKKPGRNTVFPPGLWQGQKDLNPRHAVLETAALPTELYPYVKFCLIILSFSKVVVNGFFKIFLRVSKNRGECCFSSYLAVSAKNTLLFGEAQPSVKE